MFSLVQFFSSSSFSWFSKYWLSSADDYSMQLDIFFLTAVPLVVSTAVSVYILFSFTAHTFCLISRNFLGSFGKSSYSYSVHKRLYCHKLYIFFWCSRVHSIRTKRATSIPNSWRLPSAFFSFATGTLAPHVHAHNASPATSLAHRNLLFTPVVTLVEHS